ncbi:hypothetical protein GSI_07263 [Ganoderma sinense ZZ0214-1]|uniref:F-box domain-containing protein n=1 Tax=Ganoderma sinense ZZ0214-1 TaxID=1077348 RepID=A0A2G8S9X0_9APHY|nr:hypothetical protein GSI_07263 [Ganoderma sinense ZZ0214-1]
MQYLSSPPNLAHSSTMPRTTKKARTSGTKGKQTRGATIKLGSGATHVMNLPVDVFLEIVVRCHPLDLLRLSRVSSDLRAVLLAKRNKGVWVSARNSLDPPMSECPEDLSEPQYASLVFDRFCTASRPPLLEHSRKKVNACGVVGKGWKEEEDNVPSWNTNAVELTTSYAARVRLCNQCWKTNIKAGYTITNELDLKIRRDRSLKRVLFDLVPEAKVCRERVLGVMVINLEFDAAAYGNMPIPHRVTAAVHQTSRQYFYQQEVVAVAKEYCSIVESSRDDSKAVDEFIERRKAHMLKRQEFHFVIDQWDYDRYRARAEVKLKALRARKAAIEKRLEELGYESPDWLRTPEFETEVNRTEPLTEVAWDKMQPKLLAALAPRRALREATEFREKYHLRSSQLKTHYFAFLASSRSKHPWKRTLPHFVEASKLPCVRALVKAAPTPDTPLLPEHFAAIADTLRDEAQPYLQKARADVARIFRLARAGELGVPWDSPADAALGVDLSGAADPEMALLDVHDALFRCSSFPCSDYARTAMTVSGLLEHWQKGHPYEWNGAQRIWLADREKRERVPRLIEALGLPKDTTISISALEDKVADRTGSPTCSCGKAIEPAKNRYEVLDRLLCHLLPPQSASDAPDTSQDATTVKHLITFGPTTRVDA